jgi:hypothetical protein
LYAAKFKLPTVASVFKIGGNDLSKPIGSRVKSVVDTDERDVPGSTIGRLKGIMFDRYYKIPKPKGNKIKPGWVPTFISMFKDEMNFNEYLRPAAFGKGRGK